MTPALLLDPWLDAHEAAAYLRLSPSRVRDLARAGELREDGRGPKGIRMWRRSTLDAWARGTTEQVTADRARDDGRTTAAVLGGNIF